jgi:hypothetical protein
MSHEDFSLRFTGRAVLILDLEAFEPMMIDIECKDTVQELLKVLIDQNIPFTVKEYEAGLSEHVRGLLPSMES